MTKKAEDFFKRHMFTASLLIALVAAMIYFMPVNMSLETSSFEAVAEFFLIVVPTLTALFGYPIALTVLELFFLVRRPDGTFRTQEHIYDGLTLILGVLYTALYLWFMGGDYSEETDSILYAWSNVHCLPAILILGALGLIGYLVLTYTPRPKLARPVPALCLAAMVLACGAGIAFAAQAISRPCDFWAALLPLNMVFITVRTMRALK